MQASSDLIQTVAGLKSAEDAKTSDPSRKHRGLWSFLTRTFVLGQLIVAEQFIGSAARAGEADEAPGAEEGSSDSIAGAGGAASAPNGVASSDETGATTAADAVHVKTSAVAGPQVGGPGVPGPGDGVADVTTEVDAAAHVTVVALNGAEASETDNLTTPGHGPCPGGGDGGPGNCGIIQPIVVTPLDPVIEVVDSVGGTVNDVLGTVETVVGSVLDTVQEIVTPTVEILATTLSETVEGVVEVASTTVDVAFDAVKGILAPLPVVGEPLTAITTGVENVVSTTLDTASTVVVGAVDTVQEIVTPTVEILTTTLSGTVEGVVEVASTTVDVTFDAVKGILAPLPVVAEPLTAVTTGVENVVSTTLDTASTVVVGAVDKLGQTVDTVVADAIPAVSNIVGSGVIPVLQSVASTTTNPDTLFEGGRYSDFNITLQSVEPITGAVSGLGSAADDLLNVATDILDLPSGPPAIAISSLLGDPLKGGLGDLFS